MQNKVVHCKKEPFDVYIGRPSKWGNPFAIGKDGTRQEVIAKYRDWIQTQPQLLSTLHELRDKVLGCWCAPYPCHGDVLVAMANSNKETTMQEMPSYEFGEVVLDLPVVDNEFRNTDPDTALQAIEADDLFILAGTGSSSLQKASNEGKAKLMAWLETFVTKTLERHPNLVIMSGMSEGFDKALALVALKLNIPLWVAIPNPSYGEYYWGTKSLTGTNQLPAFNAIVAGAWRVSIVMPGPKGSAKYNNKYGLANFDRNDYMVAQANVFLVYDAGSPGTKHCLKGIKESGKPYKIAPIVS